VGKMRERTARIGFYVWAQGTAGNLTGVEETLTDHIGVGLYWAVLIGSSCSRTRQVLLDWVGSLFWDRVHESVSVTTDFPLVST
jgi:hypothetical protein